MRLFLIGVATAVIALGLASLTPARASSANISRSYRANSAIKDGSIVSLDSGQTGYVVPANVDNGSKLLGVAVASDNSLIAVDAASGKVQVATNGSVITLVSTLNGDIKVGDPIAVSPFNGVGMRASSPGARVIGLAQTAFNGGTSGATDETVTTKDGQKKSVKLGYVRISVGIDVYAASSTANTTGLEKIAETITGHTVPIIRIIISIAVGIVTIFILVTLVYASIYGSIISVGRNPLAKYAVLRTLALVLSLALLTTIIAGLIIFLLLR